MRILLQMFKLPLSYRLLLLLIGSIAFVDLLLFELLIVSGPVANWLRRKTNTGRRPQLEDEEDAAAGAGGYDHTNSVPLDKSSLNDTAVALEEQDSDTADEDQLREDDLPTSKGGEALATLDV
jgi:hypothetical protein